MNNPKTARIVLKKLTLCNFKNFRRAAVDLGPFAVLVGANATGKSNVREAFRFLHGIGRGYALPEIIGEKWGKGGERVWDGIRGGVTELSYQSSASLQAPDNERWSLTHFSIKAEFDYWDSDQITDKQKIAYSIKIGLVKSNERITPYVDEEYLTLNGRRLFKTRGFDSQLTLETQEAARRNDTVADLELKLFNYLQQIRGERSAQRPYLLQINDQNEQDKKSAETVEITTAVLDFFASMRFQNLNTDLMRLPSLPGQPFGERGENLSAALFTICQNPEQKKTLLSWIEDLTPMEAVDFEFPADQIGRVLLTLVERNGQKISAYSASDGTLRLLAMLAALLDPEPAQLYFFEELENGIHPTRLHLLTQLIENQTAVNPIQVVATTHSPHLLHFLSPQTIENVSLLYRLDDRPDADIKRIVDIPHARHLIQTQGIGRLHESNWFEDALFFMDEEDNLLEQEAAA